MNYYNEHDAKAAAWLRELIKAGLIPNGDVDERSIAEVQPAELRDYTQCHFFAGIGGWSLALQLAGWSADKPVWTGSCPCQPFSTAGKGLAQADERHLWPVFFNLIKECKPNTVFGEQVASAIGKGWLDGVSSDLESEGYACGSVVLGAHSVGAPHIRQRLYWVADSSSQGLQGHRESGEQPMEERRQGTERYAGTSSTRDQRMVQPNSDRCEQRDIASTSTGHRHSAESAGSWEITNSPTVETEKAAAFQLNPHFSRWLMGFPPEWCNCAVMAMQSFPKSQRSSLEPTVRPIDAA